MLHFNKGSLHGSCPGQLLDHVVCNAILNSPFLKGWMLWEGGSQLVKWILQSVCAIIMKTNNYAWHKYSIRVDVKTRITRTRSRRHDGVRAKLVSTEWPTSRGETISHEYSHKRTRLVPLTTNRMVWFVKRWQQWNETVSDLLFFVVDRGEKEKERWSQAFSPQRLPHSLLVLLKRHVRVVTAIQQRGDAGALLPL